MILGLLILALIIESFYLGRFTQHRIETLITLSVVWFFGYVCGEHGHWIMQRFFRWRTRKWTKAHLAGWYLNKLVDSLPVMRKHGKYEIVEMKDVEQGQKPK